MTHAGGPFDWWCYTKVKMLRDRYLKRKGERLNGFLWKAPRGSDSASAKKASFKLRYFELGYGCTAAQKKKLGINEKKSEKESTEVEYLHYYELTPSLKHLYETGVECGFGSSTWQAKNGSNVKQNNKVGSPYSYDTGRNNSGFGMKTQYQIFMDNLDKYRQNGIEKVEASGGLLSSSRSGQSIYAGKYYKGSFMLELGNGRVSIPKNLTMNPANTPTPYPFMINNVGGANDVGRKKTDSVVVLCAPSNDIRRTWMEYLKSHMVRSTLIVCGIYVLVIHW